jgi:hypothetical protein
MNSICCVKVMSLIVALKLHNSCSYIVAIKLHKLYNSIYDELSLLQLCDLFNNIHKNILNCNEVANGHCNSNLIARLVTNHFFFHNF